MIKFLKPDIKTKDYEGGDRRGLLTSMDMLTKVLLILLTILNGLMGWGVKEVFNSLRTHEKDITVLQVENKSQTGILEFVRNEQLSLAPRLIKTEERQLSIEGKLDVLSTGITARLVSIEQKIDRITETGILDGTPNRRRW